MALTVKRALAIGLAAGLVLTLTAAADQTQRFRWLGVAGRLALLAADEGGPRDGRTLTVTPRRSASRGPTAPTASSS